jgi:PAS domain S-box-containing protein
LRRLHAADPDLEIVLLADRAWLGPGLSAAGNLPETVDILGLPFSEAELARRVELARERRFLRRSEQRRKGSEARTSAIMKAVPSGIMSLDPEGVVHDWNPAASRMFGWSDVEALGRRFWDLVGVERTPFLDDAGQLTLGKKLELTARHRSGNPFPIEMSLVSFPLAERLMFCAIVEDRSEAKRLELDLRQAQKLEAVGQLAAGLAHEINTPCQFIGDNAASLTAFLADLEPLLGHYAELAVVARTASLTPDLLDQIGQAEERADLDYWIEQGPKSLTCITEGVQRIAGIVSAMKSFARINWTDGASLDVNEALTNILTVMEQPLKGVAEVETDLQELPPIIGHGGDLNQAFYNIIRNAIDAIESRFGTAGGRQGRISVRTRRDGDAINLDIADNGCGVPEAIRGRIFDQFFTTKPVGSGTGQGLAVAWSVIVDKHGGRLSFDSSEGSGTTFHVRLPYSPSHPAPS